VLQGTKRNAELQFEDLERKVYLKAKVVKQEDDVKSKMRVNGIEKKERKFPQRLRFRP
jgi:hypothetical protein